MKIELVVNGEHRTVHCEQRTLLADLLIGMWGGLDILRDRDDGRLYIVDVNKTDLGPVISLSWRDKVRSMRRLAIALEALVTTPEHGRAGARSAPAVHTPPPEFLHAT